MENTGNITDNLEKGTKFSMQSKAIAIINQVNACECPKQYYWQKFIKNLKMQNSFAKC